MSTQLLQSEVRYLQSEVQYLQTLSQNFIGLLKDEEYCDVKIEVGEDPDVKTFDAHTNILACRSSYLQRQLATYKKNNDHTISHLKFSNISPKIFQIILKYIYGGILSIIEEETSDILEVLVAADTLDLQEFSNYCQKYLIANRSEWMEQNFEYTQRTSLHSKTLSELQQFCINFMDKYPEKIFKSIDFISLPEKYLVSLIERNDLQMKEIEIWEHVLKWGVAQNSTLVLDPDTWSDDDFKMVENTLQHCLPLIRFYRLSSKEFSQNVHPYEKLLKRQVYEDLLNSYINPDSEPNDKISLPRNISIDGFIDSKIVDLRIVSIISRWIDKVDINSKFTHLRGLYLPYKFELLLRGSRDGFTPNKFHELCDNKSYTVNKVEDVDHALNYHHQHGPYFGDDLLICSEAPSAISRKRKLQLQYETNYKGFVRSVHESQFAESIEYNTSYSKQHYYEKSIRDTEDKFSIEDYEVFQIIIK